MLNHPKIQAAIKAGKRQRLADGQGLLLAIMPSGSASWILRVQSGGRRRDVGLGGYPRLSLSDAREKAREKRATAKAGGNPTERPRPMPTFAEAARAALECRAKAWRGSATARDWWASITNHCGDLLNRPVDSITGPDVIAVLEPVIRDHPSLGPALRQRVRRVFGWAMSREHIDRNPAGEAIDAALPPPGAHRPQHHAALPAEQVGAALDAVDALPETGESVKLAIFWLTLTACRSGEARGAAWSEIDLQARTWTLPPERTKTGRQHRIPLSSAALRVLDRAKALRDSSALLFPSPKGARQLDPKSLRNALQSAGIETTIHGMRSAFRDWGAERGERFDALEIALGHSVGGSVIQAYARTDLLEARKGIMQAWGAYIEGETVTS